MYIERSVNKGEMMSASEESAQIELSALYDAHSHLQLDLSQRGRAEALRALSELRGAALMSTEPPDWSLYAELMAELSAQLDGPAQRQAPRQAPRCLYGIHPWFAHKYASDLSWIDELSARLDRDPRSAIGEIGLDRQWRAPETGLIHYEAQLIVFKAQLSLAAERDLPVSLHCVRAQGDLQRILAEAPSLPPVIYLHAFGGARGTVEQLIRAQRYGERLYFGFASCIDLRSKKCHEAIKAVPDDRLVLESDRSSAAPLERMQRELNQMLSLYAELKGWSGPEEAAEHTARNAERLYAGSTDRLTCVQT